MQRPAKRRLKIALVLASLYLVACFAITWISVRPSRMPVTAPPAGFTKHLIHADAHDVPAWVARAPAGRPHFVFAHPLRSTPAMWTLAAQDVYRAGFGATVLTLRSACDNPEPTIGFGVGEADEVVAACRQIRQQSPQSPVIVVGCSMGGAAAWIASRKAPDAVDVVVSDSAFSDLGSGVDDWMDDKVPFGHILLAPMKLFGRWITGADLSHPDALEAARLWRGKPALVVHGGQDAMFGVQHARRLAEASGAELWLVSDAGHGSAYGRRPQEYAAKLSALANRLQAAKRTAADYTPAN